MSSLSDPAAVTAPPLWRSLAELAGAGAAPGGYGAAPLRAQEAAGLDRRQFLQNLAASLALAGVGACSRPPQGELVPYVHAPPGQVDGLPRFFATTHTHEGYGHGVLVESHMGRPTKVEGNPQHPASLGATDIFAQASVLELWDPNRSQVVSHRGETATWDDFAAALAQRSADFARDGGAGLHVLTGATTSPTLAAQLAALWQRYPRARHYSAQPTGNSQALAGARLAFGAPLATRLHLERAAVVLSLDADFLSDRAAGVRYARDFIATRDPQRRPVSRLYVIEPTPSITGAMADHRLPLEARHLEAFARRLARRLGLPVETPAPIPPAAAHWLEALAADLEAHRGAALVAVGASQPPWLHALGHALNAALGGAGTTVSCTEPVETLAGDAGALADLVAAMHDGAVDTLLVLDANPVYQAPGDLDFAAALPHVTHLMHLGLYRDETGALAEWHLPQAHEFEAWSDARAFDGTASLVQPLIAPLNDGRSVHEVLAMLLGAEVTDGRALLRNQWRPLLDDAAWTRALEAGVVAGTALAPSARPLQRGFLATPMAARDDERGPELLFRPDATVGDGRWANNAWLQELPKPITQLTWDNAALVSPAYAAQQQLRDGDVIELRRAARALRAPVCIVPGQAAGSITLPLGYGRRHAGQVGDGRGFDAYLLRAYATPGQASGVLVRRTDEHYTLAGTQLHFRMEGRAPVRVGTFAAASADAAGSAPPAAAPPLATLYGDYPPGEYAWGMSIDLNACIGCKACTIACQAENNIPVVGKEQVSLGREMHWIRVDQYHQGEAANPSTYSQPVPCMMCEHAPCELVCPVDATVHDSEGLNVQVYNRCVGTRFCSNNCPYKVRRFNFLQYVDESAELLKAQRNPEVSVRRRGVMEKCSYCIQRIEAAHIATDREGRRIRDGEVLTACQAVCPTQAIRFGDTADPHSAVAQAKASARNYLLLGELNTRPRTSYLARLRNPNPALGGD